MENKLKQLYNLCPVFLQNSILSGFSILLDRERYSGKYKFFQDLLSKTQWYTESDLIAYQENQLEKLISHAYETVPYYRQIFQDRKLVPKDIKKLSDLQKLPLLTKHDIKNNFNKLISTKYKSSG